MSHLLIVFAKAPVAGLCKTRMQPQLTPQQAADLQRRLINHTLQTTQQLRNTVAWWCTPDCGFIRPLLADGQQCHIQLGENLGQRMAHALQQGLLHHNGVTIIGTDCPQITTATLQHCQQLLQHNDAVIGPAADGGYYLLGLNRFDDLLMENIDWGSSNVFAQTTARLQQLQWRWQQLECKQDIDRYEDLHHYPTLLQEITAHELAS